MPDEVLEYIASHITSNIRELEGALISLLAQSTLNRKEITIDLARKMIDKLVKNTKREISIEYIQKVGHLQNQAFESLFPMVSEDTILNEIKGLVKAKIIKKKGVTKGAKYIIS